MNIEGKDELASLPQVPTTKTLLLLLAGYLKSLATSSEKMRRRGGNVEGDRPGELAGILTLLTTIGSPAVYVAGERGKTKPR